MRSLAGTGRFQSTVFRICMTNEETCRATALASLTLAIGDFDGNWRRYVLQSRFMVKVHYSATYVVGASQQHVGVQHVGVKFFTATTTGVRR